MVISEREVPERKSILTEVSRKFATELGSGLLLLLPDILKLSRTPTSD